MSYQYLENETIIWARARNIPQTSTPLAQAKKTLEEAGEMIEAASKQDVPGYRDALGDCLITLIVGAETAGVDLLECFAQAFDEIKDRKGKMINGQFVKD